MFDLFVAVRTDCPPKWQMAHSS